MSAEVDQIILAWLERIEKKVDAHGAALAALKVKSGVWGLLGGLIPVAVIMAYMALS